MAMSARLTVSGIEDWRDSMSWGTDNGFRQNMRTNRSVSLPGWMWPYSPATWTCWNIGPILYGEKWRGCGR